MSAKRSQPKRSSLDLIVAEMKRLLASDALAFLMELSVAPYAAKLLSNG